jgi:hypothetical protein
MSQLPNATSLFLSTQLPTNPDLQGGIAQQYAAYKRPSSGNTQTSNPRALNQPMVQPFLQQQAADTAAAAAAQAGPYRTGGNTQYLQQAQPAPQQHMPVHPDIQARYNQAVQAGGPRTLTVDPEGVAHGYTERRGGASFQRGEHGELIDPAADAASNKLQQAHDIKEQPTWKDYQKSDEQDYDQFTKHADHLAGQMGREFRPDRKAALQQQLDATQQQMDQIHSRLHGKDGGISHYQAMEADARAKTDPTVVQGVHVGGNAASQQINEAEAHMSEPVQVKPGEDMGGYNYVPVDPAVQRLPIQQKEAAQQQTQAQQQHAAAQQRIAASGVPEAPEAGAALTPGHAAAIMGAAGNNPTMAKRLAEELGYDPTKQPQQPGGGGAGSWSGAMSGGDMRSE